MILTPSICAALVTPVDAEGAIDGVKFAAHGQWILNNGCDGLVVFGTTGEATSFSTKARRMALADLLNAGVPANKVIVGTGCCSVAETASLSRHALGLGCHGVLIHPPYFYKDPGLGGIFDFYARVVDGLGHSQANIYLYHFPDMTAVPISFDLIERLLSSFPAFIAGIKDSTGDFENTKQLVHRFPGLRVFTGDDHLLRPLLEIGGAGAITATANLTPNLLADVKRSGAKYTSTTLSAHEILCGLWRDTLLKFPVSEAVKEIMAEISGDDTWRLVCPPLQPLVPAQRQHLRSLAQTHLASVPPGLGLGDCEVIAI